VCLFLETFLIIVSVLYTFELPRDTSYIRHRYKTEWLHLLLQKGISLGFVDNRINPLKMKRRLLYLKTHFVPRSKHYISVIKTKHFMLRVYKSEIAVLSAINRIYVYTVQTESIVVNVEPVGESSSEYVSKG
jgi:hypothetical protein